MNTIKTTVFFGVTRKQRLANALYWLNYNSVNLDPGILPLSMDEVLKRVLGFK